MKPINQEKLTQAIEESLQRQKIFANRSEMPASLRTPEIRIILKAIDKEKIMEFTPSFSYQKGVSYPELERILPPPKTNNGLLDELEKFGAMKKEFYDSFTACPKCDSNRISLKFRCSSCNSTDIDRQTKIEHVPCRNVDAYEKFVKGKNLICPRCGKELKTLNVDYKEIEPHFECHNCKSSARPKHEYKCENCKESYNENQLYLKKMFKFTITPAQRTLIEKWVRDFDTLLESARELYRGTNEFYDPDAPKVSFSQMAKRG
jgi:hypothetical protein